VDVDKLLKELSAIDQAPDRGTGRSFEDIRGEEVTPLEKGGLRLGGLNFRSGSAELSPQGKAVLDQVAAKLKAKPGFILMVDGHTDTDPISKTKSTNASNWELSGKRAAAVVDYLVKAGVCKGGDAFLRGFGEFRGISPDKAKNRRVEIYVFDAPGLAGGSNVKGAGLEDEPVTPAPPPTRPAPKPAPKAPPSDDPTLK